MQRLGNIIPQVGDIVECDWDDDIGYVYRIDIDRVFIKWIIKPPNNHQLYYISNGELNKDWIYYPIKEI